jgi:ankyrin repeat protein
MRAFLSHEGRGVLDLRNRWDMTALHIAFANGNAGMAQALLEAGAGPLA